MLTSFLSHVRGVLGAAFVSIVAVVPAEATVVNYLLSFENDMELLNDPFGFVSVSDEIGVNKLTFTIDIDNTKLGANADIQMFGFQVNGFAGSLTLSPTVISSETIQLFVGPSNDTKVAGMGNTEFDYLVHFGNGNPVLEPVMFMLQGDTTFGLANLDPMDTVLTNTGKVTNFGLHVQSTSTQPGSEAFGGHWFREPPTTTNAIPEPTSVVTWLVLGSFALAFRNNRKTAERRNRLLLR
jgi:hypothetical protein